MTYKQIEFEGHQQYSRSNYFLVKEAAAFQEWCKSLHLEYLPGDDGSAQQNLWMVRREGPWIFHRDVDGVRVELDFIEELAKHVSSGYVVVLISVGMHRLQYLEGNAVAFNSQGQRTSINLEHIYDQAESLGTIITRAEY